MHFNFLLKSVNYIPFMISQRWKVRILPPKDALTPYARPTPKPTSKFSVDFYSFVHRENLTLAHLKNWLKWKQIKEMREDQSYLPERHKILGPDLATTHFLAARGGRVKFVNSDKWVTVEHIHDVKIPNFYVPGFFVEEIDASGTNLCYEGFDNLSNLTRLKKLNLSSCPFIDDWCLSRTHLFANTLEYLDLSGCHLITERGICTLHTLKKLKVLVVNDTPNIQNKELVCLLLQDIIPDCKIIGVDYEDPILLKRIEEFIH